MRERFNTKSDFNNKFRHAFCARACARGVTLTTGVRRLITINKINIEEQTNINELEGDYAVINPAMNQLFRGASIYLHKALVVNPLALFTRNFALVTLN